MMMRSKLFAGSTYGVGYARAARTQRSDNPQQTESQAHKEKVRGSKDSPSNSSGKKATKCPPSKRAFSWLRTVAKDHFLRPQHHPMRC